MSGATTDPFGDLRAKPPLPMCDRVLAPSACLGTDARRGYIVKGLIAAGDVAAIVGHPGSGKSIAAPHVAYSVAQGRHVFGLRTKQGKVLYAAAEDFTGMKQRVAALYKQFGDAPAFRLVDIGNLRTKPLATELLNYVVEDKPALVFIDTIGAAFAGLEENSAKDMGEVVKLARLIAETGAAVILIHHIAKAGDGSPRGHSVLNGTLDACLLLTLTDGVCRAKLTKNRNGPCDLDIAFRITKAELGLDEDGDPITAPIAAEFTPQDLADRLPPMTPSEKTALSIFHQVATLSDDGSREIALEPWRDACVAGGISGATNPKYQKQATKVAIDRLVEKSIVTFSADDGRYRAKARRVAAEDEFHAEVPPAVDVQAFVAQASGPQAVGLRQFIAQSLEAVH